MERKQAVEFLKERIRFIEAEFSDVTAAHEYVEALEAAIEALESVPAADAVEVRHGHRVIKKEDKLGFDSGWYFLYCSECDRNIRKYYDYCPWCGARMDGQRREDGDA